MTGKELLDYLKTIPTDILEGNVYIDIKGSTFIEVTGVQSLDDDGDIVLKGLDLDTHEGYE